MHRVHGQVNREVATSCGEPDEVRAPGRAARSTPPPAAAGEASRVVWVAVSAPNSGTVVEAAQSRAGSIETKCTARVSPGCGTFDVEGTGLRIEERELAHLTDTRSFSLRTLPAKQSSVNTSRTVPGRDTWRRAARPPKVQAYCSGVGLKAQDRAGRAMASSSRHVEGRAGRAVIPTREPEAQRPGGSGRAARRTEGPVGPYGTGSPTVRRAQGKSDPVGYQRPVSAPA